MEVNNLILLIPLRLIPNLRRLQVVVPHFQQSHLNAHTIKKNLTATSERRLTGNIDFLGDIATEKPIQILRLISIRN